MNKFSLVLVRWFVFTAILWIIAFMGFSAMSASFDISTWPDVHRGNFGVWLIIFGVLSLVGSGFSIAE